MIQESDHRDHVKQEIEKEIEKLLEEEKKKMDGAEYEKYRDKVFAVAELAEEEGFIKGFKYAVMLMAECFQHGESTTAGF